mmetsp:Transcript_10387/g.15949  ORF Transcript_10387/g.15949 Transcript_10387/m.15949 type:complete len:139 (-) Transcript_10387:49-465(-)
MQCNKDSAYWCRKRRRVMGTSRLGHALRILTLIPLHDFSCAALPFLARNYPLSSWSWSSSPRTSTLTSRISFLRHSSSGSRRQHFLVLSKQVLNETYCLHETISKDDDTVVDCGVIAIGGGLVGMATAVALHSKQQSQ